MISIVNSRWRGSHLETYRQWVSKEWESDHSFDSPDGTLLLPPPLLAMFDERLAGGVSFTWHAAPGSSDTALWINTVYVEPSFRGGGVASALVRAAEEEARMATAEKALLVYTDIPGLYRKSGWTPTGQEGVMWVLRKEL